MSEEIQELHEYAEEAHRDPSLIPATLSMAIVAVVLAAISLLGHRTHTEELLLQRKATHAFGRGQLMIVRPGQEPSFHILVLDIVAGTH